MKGLEKKVKSKCKPKDAIIYEQPEEKWFYKEITSDNFDEIRDEMKRNFDSKKQI